MSFDIEKELSELRYTLLWRRKIRFGKIGLGLGWMTLVAGYREEEFHPGSKSWCACVRFHVDPTNQHGCGGFLYSKFFDTEEEARQVLMDYGHQEVLTTIDFD